MTQSVANGQGGPAAPAPAGAQPPAGAPGDQAATQGPPAFDAAAALQIIEQRRQAREQEARGQQSTQETEALKKKLQTYESREQQYQSFFKSLKERPRETLVANGFKQEDVAELYKNGAVEGTPQHQIHLALQQANQRAEALEKKIADMETRDQERTKGYETALVEQTKAHHIEQLFMRADPEKHTAFIAWFGNKQDQAYELANEFSAAYCEHNKVRTCPYPIIQAFLEEVARKEAGPLIDRVAPRMGYAKAEPVTDPKAAAKKASTKAPTAEAKAEAKEQEGDFSTLPKEEQRRRTEEALKKNREARGKK